MSIKFDSFNNVSTSVSSLKICIDEILLGYLVKQHDIFFNNSTNHNYIYLYILINNSIILKY